MTFPASKSRIRSIPLKLYIVFAGVGAILISVIIYALKLGTEIAGQYAVLVDAAKEIRFEVTEAYLVYGFPEVHHDESLQDLESYRERTSGLNRALLEGGIFNGSVIPSISDAELRGRLFDLLSRQDHFFDILEDRIEISLSGRDHGHLQMLSETVYHDFVERANGVEKRLKAVISDRLAWLRWVQYILIAFTLFCLTATGWIFMRFLHSREKQNALLRESEERFRLLVENADDLFFLIRAKDERIRDANTRACEVLEYDMAELLKCRFHEIEIEDEGICRRGKKFDRAGMNFREETILKSRGGRRLSMEANISVVEMDRELFWVAIARDISARKRMEEELRRAKRAADEANRAKSAFLANMSHEVRTPINGIMGMLQLAGNSELNPEQKEYIEIAMASCRSLTTLLSDILDLSRVEAGRIEIVEEEFEVGALLQSVAVLFRQALEDTGVTLRWEIDESVPERLIGDLDRLKQILANLVGNAAKFTESGEIVIRIGANPLQRLPGKENIQIRVSDTGIGIPKRQIDKVFDAFQQVDGSYTRKHQGVGLGLSIVKKLVTLMDGSISVTSELEVGTTFTVILPMGVPDELSAKQVGDLAVTPPAFSGKKALVVDDHETNLLSVTSILKQMGIETVSAVDGAEALKKLEKETFDFALMDIQLPKMDGMSVTREIRNNKKYGSTDLPIIAMTAYAMQGDREQFLEGGMDGYLAKPFEIDELKTVIEQVMKQKDPG